MKYRQVLVKFSCSLNSGVRFQPRINYVFQVATIKCYTVVNKDAEYYENYKIKLHFGLIAFTLMYLYNTNRISTFSIRIHKNISKQGEYFWPIQSFLRGFQTERKQHHRYLIQGKVSQKIRDWNTAFLPDLLYIPKEYGNLAFWILRFERMTLSSILELVSGMIFLYFLVYVMWMIRQAIDNW